ncbi:MAG: peptide chain release factor 3, partial [Cytophagales bacterium]|nr:peptide chain release factor 3 [Cytophagales bacterium]
KREDYLSGKIAPVFFGSAVNSFGIKELLETFIELSPLPIGRQTNERYVEPSESKFSGFIFKIHANLDPKHRDRIAFLRIVSGKFERNKFFYQVRTDKSSRFSSPVTFMASAKNIVEEAYPGDVVGLYDTGNFKIGDTLTEGEKFIFQGIPSFSPEIYKELVNLDPLKSKQLDKGISQLTDEGVAQLFTQQPGNRKLVGVVGELQFDVIQYRLQHEYGASCRFQPLNIAKSCWITSEDKKALDEFLKRRHNSIAFDKDENPVFLADSDWTINLMIKEYPEIHFHTTSEFKNRVTSVY